MLKFECGLIESIVQFVGNLCRMQIDIYAVFWPHIEIHASSDREMAEVRRVFCRLSVMRQNGSQDSHHPPYRMVYRNLCFGVFFP